MSPRVRKALLTSTVQVIRFSPLASPKFLNQSLLKMVNVEAANLRVFHRTILVPEDELVINSVQIAEKAFPRKTKDERVTHRSGRT